MPPKDREMKVVMTVPDLGLTKAQINTLKKKFRSEMVESLGGPAALARRRIIIVIVVVVVVVQ